ncbi:hypothetical protein ABH926_003433 [Catenulispora sp. GP43]|uniref:hypothetical protein n=1 Tax=Catenulispora sp. GP43 TaxID=3156263 RepID=UPI003515A38C
MLSKAAPSRLVPNGPGCGSATLATSVAVVSDADGEDEDPDVASASPLADTVVTAATAASRAMMRFVFMARNYARALICIRSISPVSGVYAPGIPFRELKA